MTEPTPKPKARRAANVNAIHYVNNADLQVAIVAHKEKCAIAKEKALPNPRISDFIGSCLMKIAAKLANSRNFVNYSYKDEMIEDGVENCILYFNNYDPVKYSNPFSYFTQIIYYAFLRRIHREKKQLYIKHKVMMNNITSDNIAEHADHDEGGFDVEVSDSVTNSEYMNNFVKQFEAAAKKKRTPDPNKPVKVKKPKKGSVIDVSVE
jgi:hypothetical protein